MRKRILPILCLCCTFFFRHASGADYAGLIINEFVTNTSDDWVELTLLGTAYEEMDISALFVTMYYGDSSISPLAEKPVTICRHDKPETPYDDRFVVIHLSNPSGIDETDDVGDLNGNKIRDIYCNNYSGSLWNTSGLVAIDTDRDYKNGMIDCVVYSNMSGTLNSNVKNYAEAAITHSQWVMNTADIQESCVDIGLNGLAAYMSVSRRHGDSNSKNDFYVTRFQTPGMENIEASPISEQSTFKVLDKKIYCKMAPGIQKLTVRLLVSQQCNMRLRVFSATGRMLYESPLYREVMPGYFSISWEGNSLRQNLPTGLYPGVIEATGKEYRGAVSRRVFFVIGR